MPAGCLGVEPDDRKMKRGDHGQGLACQPAAGRPGARTGAFAVSRRWSPSALCLAAAMLSGAAAAQALPDAERGRALYENHCQVCHTPRVHSRANRLPISRGELREIVDNWQRQEALGWSSQDVADVVEFLNRTRYGYAP